MEVGPIHRSIPSLDVTGQLKILMASFTVLPTGTTIMTRTAIEITTGTGITIGTATAAGKRTTTGMVTTTETGIEITMATAGMRRAVPIRKRAVKSMRKEILYALFARPWVAIGLDLRSMIMIAVSAKS
jgi:hypothetical protein